MTLRDRIASVLLLAMLAACSGGDSHTDTALPEPQDLCVDTGCGRLETLLRIPDAENLLFSDDGRLFVSGGENVYEVARAESGLIATPLSASGCNFTGLAIRAETLYAACFDGQLYAAPLTAVAQLAAITPLGIAAPNGMAVGPDDALYIINGPVATTALPDPKILRVALAPGSPLQATDVSVWLEGGMLAPNGLQADGDQFYFSESGLPDIARVRRLTWTAEGPGPIETVASFIGVPDDFSLLPSADGPYLLVPDFGLGGLRLFAPNGDTQAALPPLTLRFPSQARRGQPPLFSSDEILITEKGVLGDTVSPIGNRLSVFRRAPVTD